MKKVLLLLFLGVCLNVNSQETSRQKELGIAFSSLNNFGIVFRLGNEKAMWRFTGMQVSGIDNNRENIRNDINNSDNTDESSSFGFSVSSGREYRKLINDKFELRYGFDLFFGYNDSKNEFGSNNNLTLPPFFSKTKIVSTSFSYGVNAVLGFNYIHNSLVFGAELQPFIAMQETESERTDSRNVNGISETFESTETSSGINYGLNNNFALISIAYRF